MAAGVIGQTITGADNDISVILIESSVICMFGPLPPF